MVLTIMAIATAGVMLALRDSSTTTLEREAQRLGALLESARAQSRMTGAAVRWHTTETGFVFEGLAPTALPTGWFSADVRSDFTGDAILGPEPIIAPQSIGLVSISNPARRLVLSTDGVHPFTVQAQAEKAPGTP